LFNTIEDGILVADEQGRIVYFNQAVTRLIGLQPATEDRHVADVLPEVNWTGVARVDQAGGAHFSRLEFEVQYPRQRFLRLYAAPLDAEATGSSGVALILHAHSGPDAVGGECGARDWQSPQCPAHSFAIDGARGAET
jgi:PAS domain S-box-containing protein